MLNSKNILACFFFDIVEALFGLGPLPFTYVSSSAVLVLSFYGPIIKDFSMNEL